MTAADPRVFVIFNPASGRGRGAARMPRYLELLERHVPGFQHAVTGRAGDEAALVARALAGGARTIAAMGGDGTWSLVADHLLRAGRGDVSLALLPAGTGNDFGKSVGAVWERAEAVVRAIGDGARRRIDVGRCDGRHFLNVVGLGFDIAVIDDALTLPVLRGDALYRFSAMRQLFRFPGVRLTIEDDEGGSVTRDHLMLIIANARFFGGTFRIAPRASLTDGRLDAVSIMNQGPFARMRAFRRVSAGTHEALDTVTIRQSRRFRVAFAAPLRYELDGEVYAAASEALTIESVPAALELVVPEDRGAR